MTRPLLLESFDGVQTSCSESEAGLVEEKWLEAFEKGYKDGWEDAESALTRRQGHITDAFAEFRILASRSVRRARLCAKKYRRC